jgi:hypothetical protein
MPCLWKATSKMTCLKNKHYTKHASQIKLHRKALTTWAPHYYTLPMTINWWKIWLDIVENKSHLDDLILNEFA